MSYHPIREHDWFFEKSVACALLIASNVSCIVEDLDADGCLDVLIVGNQYPVEVETGRYDAQKGLFLKGNCQGDFEAIPYAKSGFFVDGDAKATSLIAIGAG